MSLLMMQERKTNLSDPCQVHKIKLSKPVIGYSLWFPLQIIQVKQIIHMPNLDITRNISHDSSGYLDSTRKIPYITFKEASKNTMRTAARIWVEGTFLFAEPFNKVQR